MKPKRIAHNIILVACLTALGASLWYAMRRMTPAVAGATARNADTGRSAHLSPAPLPGSPLRMNNSIPVRPPEAVRERRARLDDVITRHQALAAAQQAALAAQPELEQAEVLADFADSNRQAIAAAAAAQDRFLNPPGEPASTEPLPGAVAANARFDAVRRAILEDGLSLEDAEARAARAAPSP